MFLPLLIADIAVVNFSNHHSGFFTVHKWSVHDLDTQKRTIHQRFYAIFKPGLKTYGLGIYGSGTSSAFCKSLTLVSSEWAFMLFPG